MKIKEVCVYSDRAIITRELLLKNMDGDQSCSFDGLPPKLIPGTVRVKGSGDLMVIDNSLTEINLEMTNIGELNRLEDESDEIYLTDELLSRKMEILNNISASLYGLSHEEGGAPAGKNYEKAKPAEYQKFLDLYSSLLKGINGEMTALAIEKRGLKKKGDQVRFSLERLRRSSGSTAYSCRVSFRMNSRGDAGIFLSYAVSDASWRPLYDGRLLSREKIFEIISFGEISQNSGEDWEETSLSLSTAKSALGAEMPEPLPWHISLYAPPMPVQASAPRSLKKSALKPASLQDNEGAGFEEEEMMDFAPEAQAAAFPKEPEPKEAPEISAGLFAGSSASSSGLNVLFSCSAKQGIPTGGTPKKVLVSMDRLPVEYRYIIMADIEEAAYLKIKMKNTLPYPILGGPVQVFRDHDYIGESVIKNIVPGEDFELFMGTDDRIKVKRELVNRYSGKKGITGRDISIEYTFKLTIESFKDEKETLTIYEQVPVSQNKEIEVKVPNPGGFTGPDEKGTLEMVMEIMPKEKKEIIFSYSVRHPEGLPVSGLL